VFATQRYDDFFSPVDPPLNRPRGRLSGGSTFFSIFQMLLRLLVESKSSKKRQENKYTFFIFT